MAGHEEGSDESPVRNYEQQHFKNIFLPISQFQLHDGIQLLGDNRKADPGRHALHDIWLHTAAGPPGKSQMSGSIDIWHKHYTLLCFLFRNTKTFATPSRKNPCATPYSPTAIPPSPPQLSLSLCWRFLGFCFSKHASICSSTAYSFFLVLVGAAFLLFEFFCNYPRFHICTDLIFWSLLFLFLCSAPWSLYFKLSPSI